MAYLAMVVYTILQKLRCQFGHQNLLSLIHTGPIIIEIVQKVVRVKIWGYLVQSMRVAKFLSEMCVMNTAKVSL